MGLFCKPTLLEMPHRVVWFPLIIGLYIRSVVKNCESELPSKL